MFKILCVSCACSHGGGGGGEVTFSYYKDNIIIYEQYTLIALWNILYFIDKNILWNAILCMSIEI